MNTIPDNAVTALKVIDGSGIFLCGECSQPLHIWNEKRRRLTDVNPFAIGHCRTHDCSRRLLQLKIVVPTVTCEIVGKEED